MNGEIKMMTKEERIKGIEENTAATMKKWEAEGKLTMEAGQQLIQIQLSEFK